MKLVSSLLLCTGAVAFQVGMPTTVMRSPTCLRSTVEEETAAPDTSMEDAKAELIETAQSLKEEFGCLLIDSSAQDKLREAVEKLEATSEAPTTSETLTGDWTLLCSTASASLENGPLEKINGIDTSKLPFFNEGPLKEIRDTLNKSLKVQQIIKTDEMSGMIDRVDHVLQYMPPDTLSEFLDNLPDALKTLNINPLQVSESKVILVHKAEIESTSPLKTKLSLSSIVLNVAGKSQVLEPEGADVLGINIPFGEFLNAGSFDTTYMDDEIRISRSKVGIVDQLRVFSRSGTEPAVVEMLDTVEEPVMETVEDAEIVDAEEAAPEEDEKESEEDDVSPSDY